MKLCPSCYGEENHYASFRDGLSAIAACFACGKLTVCYDVQPWTDDDVEADEAEHVYDDRCED